MVSELINNHWYLDNGVVLAIRGWGFLGKSGYTRGIIINSTQQ